jgi:hypothetical protein
MRDLQQGRRQVAAVRARAALHVILTQGGSLVGFGGTQPILERDEDHPAGDHKLSAAGGPSPNPPGKRGTGCTNDPARSAVRLG